MEAAAVKDLAAVKQEAQELLDAYVDAWMTIAWRSGRTSLPENAVYKIVARENVERNLPIATMSCTSRGMMQDRVVAIRKASVFSPRYLRHIVSSVRMLGEENGAYLLHANFAVFQTMQDEETKVFMVGKYRGKMLLTADGPKFQELLAIYDSSQIPGLLAIPI